MVKETTELYYAREDEFWRYIEDEVNPHRIKVDLDPINHSQAMACYRILREFMNRWQLIDEKEDGFKLDDILGRSKEKEDET